MSKKKAKVNRYSQQKLEEAKYKKEYFKRMQEICDSLHPDLYSKIPVPHRESIFMVRGTTVKILHDANVSKEILEYANSYMRLLLREEQISLYRNGPTVSLRDYVRIVFPMEIAIIPESRGDKYTAFVESFRDQEWYIKFEDYMIERETEFQDALQKLRITLSFCMSDMRYMLYHAVYDWHTDHHVGRNALRSATMERTLRVIPYKPEYKKIKLNGAPGTRRGIRISMVIPRRDLSDSESDALTYIEIPPSLFGFKGAWARQRMPIYVTEHALNRLEERLGCVYQSFIQRDMVTSLVSGNPVIRLKGGLIMVEYRLHEIKVGYLVISIQEGVILIRTFLLITNFGTPEGELLRKQSGLAKLDSQYLGLDKLTTFIYSDILDHEDLCEIFRKAKCDALFEIRKKLENDWFWQQKGEHIELAIRMRDYLKNRESEEWESEDEPETESESELELEDDANSD
jgi:hypothetical protein